LPDEIIKYDYPAREFSTCMSEQSEFEQSRSEQSKFEKSKFGQSKM